MTARDFLARFSRVRQNHKGDWHVPCPAHDDSTSDPAKFSLHITETVDRILLNCFAGCERGRVLTLLELRDADLFLTPIEPAPPPPLIGVRPTLASFAAKKSLEPVDLEAAGWEEIPTGLAIPYRHRDGSPARVRYRTSLEPGQGFKWDNQKNVPLIPYGRERLDEALEHGELWLVEGES